MSILYQKFQSKYTKNFEKFCSESGIIEKLLELGYYIREIAGVLGGSASTISREVTRETTLQMKTD